MRILNKLSIFILITISSFEIQAQKAYSDKIGKNDFTRALDLFEKEKYASAIEIFDRFVKSDDHLDDWRHKDAEYYAAVSAVMLYNNDAELRINKFVNNNPESPLVNDAWLLLANSFYNGRNYRKAIRYYGMADRLLLEDKLLPEYYFKFGYSHFMKGDRKRAMLYFSEIMDIDTEYSSPAIYYFSHIAYENEKYLTALEGFRRLTEDESFSAIVPFYIVQIMYITGDTDGIIATGPSLLKDASEDRASELYRIIGDAYFKKGNFTEAVKNLEEHVSRSVRTGREGSYQLAYCYYMTGDYEKSIPLFKEVCRRRDELSQNSYYLLGDIYIKQGDKKMAQASFSSASGMDFDKKLKEEALFNFAKLTYETSYSPFGEVIRAFQEYIEQYPGSERIEEAYDYLISAYMKVKNYEAAVNSLDRIAVKDDRLEKAYQKVAFYRGLELYRNLNLDRAVSMFDKSLKYGSYDRVIRARSLYWKAEALYRQGDTERAADLYKEFMGIPGASMLQEYGMVNYNLGYIHYNNAEYREALRWFREYEKSMVGGNERLVADLYNRIADCYYISTDYSNAITYYNRVINAGAPGADYAMFRKGFSLGLMSKQAEKITVLSELISKYPASSLVPNAIFERGRAHISLDSNGNGEDDFNMIINQYPQSPFVPGAMVQLGLLYFNNGRNQEAINEYKRVIQNYPSTPDARSALTGLRNIYVELNDVESYFSYIHSLEGYASVSSSERDSLLYLSGENLYVQGNCERASMVFRNYLDEFPGGSFSLNARFYLADCLLRDGNNDEALTHLIEVTRVPNNLFLDKTYLAMANVYFSKEDYDNSYSYYNRLEAVAQTADNVLDARVGMLRSAYQLGDPEKALDASTAVIESAGVSDELVREARFLRAKSLYALGKNSDALRDYRQLASEVITEEGAESKFRLAEIMFSEGKTDEAEEIVYEFIEQNSPHQYWMARMFILLSDISLKKDDVFQARATLQSLADYYMIDDDGILDEVQRKLSELEMSNQELPDTIKLSVN